MGPNGLMLDQDIIDKGDFNNFGIMKLSQVALKAAGIKYLFPIQVSTFPIISEGKDLIGRDRTGSGKTLAYTLPTMERLRRDKAFQMTPGQNPLVLVLVPTRELAIQVNRVMDELKQTPKEFRTLSVYGGTDINNQINSLRRGVEVIVATPGRLWDLMERHQIDLSSLKSIILDETDQMLDIGFQEMIEQIIAHVSEVAGKGNVQHLLFSATMPSWVFNIANNFLTKDYQTIDLVAGQQVKTATTVEHLAMLVPSYHQFISNISDIVSVYCGQHGTAIIFTETKQESNDVLLKANLKIECQVTLCSLLLYRWLRSVK